MSCGLVQSFRAIVGDSSSSSSDLCSFETTYILRQVLRVKFATLVHINITTFYAWNKPPLTPKKSLHLKQASTRPSCKAQASNYTHSLRIAFGWLCLQETFQFQNGFMNQLFESPSKPPSIVTMKFYNYSRPFQLLKSTDLCLNYASLIYVFYCVMNMWHTSFDNLLCNRQCGGVETVLPPLDIDQWDGKLRPPRTMLKWFIIHNTSAMGQNGTDSNLSMLDTNGFNTCQINAILTSQKSELLWYWTFQIGHICLLIPV